MKKITFGVPEEIVPSKFCDGFSYRETSVKYNVDDEYISCGSFQTSPWKKALAKEKPLRYNSKWFGDRITKKYHGGF